MPSYRATYRVTTAWCFSAGGVRRRRSRLERDRQLELLRTMLDGAVSAIEDHDALSLRPD